MLLTKLFKGALLLVGAFLLFTVQASEDRLIAHAYAIKSSNPAELKQIVQTLTLNSSELTDTQSEHLTYLKGYELTLSGHYSEAIKLLTKLAEHSTNPEILIRAHSTLANIYIPMGQWESGIANLLYVKNHIYQIDNRELKELLSTLIVFGLIHLEQYQQALGYIQKSNFEELSERQQCITSQLEFEAKLLLGQELTFQNYDLASYHCESANEKRGASIIKAHWAEYLLNSDLRRAPLVLNELEKEVENTPLIYATKVLLAQLYQLKGDDQLAKEYALAAISQPGYPLVKRYKSKAYQILFQLEEKQGYTKEALRYYKLYSNLELNKMNETLAKACAFQVVELELVEKEREIELLQKQNKKLHINKNQLVTENKNNRLYLQLAAAFGVLISLFLARSFYLRCRLRHLAEYDHLTGIYNRGHFTQFCKSALRYAKLEERESSLVAFDLDHFKQINDRYGHPIGDYVLKMVAEVCQKHIRKNDLLARIGGEEFCIYFPDCSLNTAARLAESCRIAISEISPPKEAPDLKVTASFGVTCTQESGYNLGQLLADADEALYSSKNNGRNLVSVFDKCTPPRWLHSAPFLPQSRME